MLSRYYNPYWRRFLTPDNYSYLDLEDINDLNLFAYCYNNPVMGMDPTGCFSWSSLWKGIGYVATGVGAVVAGALVIASGVALAPMLVVAGVTIGAGVLTTINGASEIGEAFSGYNFMEDGVFQGNSTAYNIYSGVTEGVSIVGSMICGGWLKANAPRIQVYNNIGNYAQTNTVAGHTNRAYNDSVLLQKQVIKYGKMTKDLQTSTGYVFRANGCLNGTSKFWRLVVSNADELILHFCFGC